MKNRLVLLITLLLAITSFIPTHIKAQDGVDNVVNTFGVAMRPEFIQDIALFPHAPLYVMNATLTRDANRATIAGDLAIRYTNQSPDNLSDIVFRLYPNLESFGGDLQISSVLVNDNVVIPLFDDTRSVMTILLPEPLITGDFVQLDLTFESMVFAGEENLYAQYSYLNGALALPNFFPLLSVYETGLGWWQNVAHSQGDAVYSETSFFDITLTSPADLVLITSGSRVSNIANADNTQTSRYLAPLMRDFAVMASPHYQTMTDSQDGIIIDVHYLPAGANGAVEVMQYTKDSVRLFNRIFGAYPYVELDVVETFTNAGRIEYPTLIVAQDESWNNINDFLEIIISHEVAHQWWYSLVGNDQTIDPWLDEALAQYSVALYYGEVYGAASKTAMFDIYGANWNAYLNENVDLTIGEPVTAYEQNAYFYIVYQKAPLFFAELATQFGEAAVINAVE